MVPGPTSTVPSLDSITTLDACCEVTTSPGVYLVCFLMLAQVCFRLLLFIIFFFMRYFCTAI